MKAAVLTALESIELREIPTPRISDDGILVRVHAVGVCGSDVSAFLGTHPYKRPPIVLGHELCGRVVEVGPGVSELRPGNLVCSMSYAPCLRCESCRIGQLQLCNGKRALSHDGWQGGFAELVHLRKGMAFALPDAVSPDIGALVEPLSIGLHAVKLLPEPPSTLAILGSGSIGVCALVAARRLGAKKIVTTDLGPQKGARALTIGADRYVDAREEQVGARVIEHLGGPADATLIASSHAHAVREALQVTRPGGTVVIVSYFPSDVLLDLNECVMREIALRFSCLSNAEDLTEVIGWLTEVRAEADALITHRYPLDHVGVALRLVASPDIDAGKVLIRPRDEDRGDVGS